MSSAKDMLSGRSLWDFPGGGVQEEMKYKGQSPEVGRGESLAKNVRDVGAKPEEEGVSESPGGGGGNCEPYILLFTHTHTPQTFIQRHGSKIWRFPDSISNFLVILQLIRSWVSESLGGLRGSQSSLHNPGLPVLPIKVPRWTLRFCTRLETLRHSYSKTKEAGSGALGSVCLPQPGHQGLRSLPSSTTQRASLGISSEHWGVRGEVNIHGHRGKNRG